MKYNKSFITLGFLSIILTGCAGIGPKQTMGGVGGAALGGLAGAQIGKGKGKLVATSVGTALGGMLGGSVGQHFDNEDKKIADSQAISHNNSYLYY